MLIRMNEGEVTREVDPFSRLENLLQKSREKRGAPAERPEAPAAVAAPQAGAEADFSDPRTREAFLGSLRTLGSSEAQEAPQDALAHQLDPERVAALLDLE